MPLSVGASSTVSPHCTNFSLYSNFPHQKQSQSLWFQYLLKKIPASMISILKIYGPKIRVWKKKNYSSNWRFLGHQPNKILPFFGFFPANTISTLLHLTGIENLPQVRFMLKFLAIQQALRSIATANTINLTILDQNKVDFQKCPPNYLPYNCKRIKGRWEINTQLSP